jgi:hypothetical protein
MIRAQISTTRFALNGQPDERAPVPTLAQAMDNSMESPGQVFGAGKAAV